MIGSQGMRKYECVWDNWPGAGRLAWKLRCSKLRLSGNSTRPWWAEPGRSKDVAQAGRGSDRSLTDGGMRMVETVKTMPPSAEVTPRSVQTQPASSGTRVVRATRGSRHHLPDSQAMIAITARPSRTAPVGRRARSPSRQRRLKSAKADGRLRRGGMRDYRTWGYGRARHRCPPL